MSFREIIVNINKSITFKSLCIIVIMFAAGLTFLSITKLDSRLSPYDKFWRYEFNQFFPYYWNGTGHRYDIIAQKLALDNYESDGAWKWNGYSNRKGFLEVNYYFKDSICDFTNIDKTSFGIKSPFRHGNNKLYTYDPMVDNCIYTHLGPASYLLNYGAFKLLSIDHSIFNMRVFNYIILCLSMIICFVWLKGISDTNTALFLIASFLSSLWFLDSSFDSSILSFEFLLFFLFLFIERKHHILSSIVSATYVLFGVNHLPIIIAYPLIRSKNFNTKNIRNALLFGAAIGIGLLLKQLSTPSLTDKETTDISFYLQRILTSLGYNFFDWIDFTFDSLIYNLTYLPTLTVVAFLGFIFKSIDSIKNRNYLFLKGILIILFFIAIQFDQFRRHVHLQPSFTLPLALYFGSYFLTKIRKDFLKYIFIIGLTIQILLFAKEFIIVPERIIQNNSFQNKLAGLTIGHNNIIPNDEFRQISEREKLFDQVINKPPFNLSGLDINIDLAFFESIKKVSFISNKPSVNCDIYDISSFKEQKKIASLTTSVHFRDHYHLITKQFPAQVSAVRLHCHNNLDTYLFEIL